MNRKMLPRNALTIASQTTKRYQLKLQKAVVYLKSNIAIAKEDLWEVKKKMLYTVETQSTPEAETMWKPR